MRHCTTVMNEMTKMSEFPYCAPYTRAHAKRIGKLVHFGHFVHPSLGKRNAFDPEAVLVTGEADARQPFQPALELAVRSRVVLVVVGALLFPVAKQHLEQHRE